MVRSISGRGERREGRAGCLTPVGRGLCPQRHVVAFPTGRVSGCLEGSSCLLWPRPTRRGPLSCRDLREPPRPPQSVVRELAWHWPSPRHPVPVSCPAHSLLRPCGGDDVTRCVSPGRTSDGAGVQGEPRGAGGRAPPLAGQERKGPLCRLSRRPRPCPPASLPVLLAAVAMVTGLALAVSV